MFRSAFPDLKIVIEDLIAEGEMIAARSIFTGTHQGTIFNLAATGRSIKIPSLTMVRIAHGLLQDSWVRSYTLGMLNQLGSEK